MILRRWTEGGQDFTHPHSLRVDLDQAEFILDYENCVISNDKKNKYNISSNYFVFFLY